MEARPQIIIKLTRVDKALETLYLIILILLWVATIAGFSELPEQIPSHFNAAGEADDYSNRISIFMLPVVASIIYTGITLLNRYPHLFNYPAKVTVENARHLYTSATRFFRIIKLTVVIIFSAIVLLTYKAVFTKSEGIGAWFLPAILALILVPVLIYSLKLAGPKKVR